MKITDLVKSITITDSENANKDFLVVSALDGVDGVSVPRIHFKQSGDCTPLKVYISRVVADNACEFWVSRSVYKASIDEYVAIRWLVRLDTRVPVVVCGGEDSIAYIEPVVVRSDMMAGESINL